MVPVHYFSTFGGKYLPEPASKTNRLVLVGAEEDEFITRLRRLFPDFCTKILSLIEDNAQLYQYFDDKDLEVHGVVYLRSLINRIALDNFCRLDKAREVVHNWTKDNAKRSSAMREPPEARAIFEKEELKICNEFYLAKAIREIWEERETVAEKNVARATEAQLSGHGNPTSDQDVVEATEAQLPDRGNSTSDPEYFVYEQMENAHVTANILGVRKEMSHVPIDGNPSSKLHVWHPKRPRRPVALSGRYGDVKRSRKLEGMGEQAMARRSTGLLTSPQQYAHQNGPSTALTQLPPMPIIPPYEFLPGTTNQPLSDYPLPPDYQVPHYLLPTGYSTLPGVSTPLGLATAPGYPATSGYSMHSDGQPSPGQLLPNGAMAHDGHALYHDLGMHTQQPHPPVVHHEHHQLQQGRYKTRGKSIQAGNKQSRLWTSPNSPYASTPKRPREPSSSNDDGDLNKDLWVGYVPRDVDFGNLGAFFSILPPCRVSNLLRATKPADDPYAWFLFLRFQSEDHKQQAKKKLQKTPCPLLPPDHRLSVRDRQHNTQDRSQWLPSHRMLDERDSGVFQQDQEPGPNNAVSTPTPAPLIKATKENMLPGLAGNPPSIGSQQHLPMDQPKKQLSIGCEDTRRPSKRNAKGKNQKDKPPAELLASTTDTGSTTVLQRQVEAAEVPTSSVDTLYPEEIPRKAVKQEGILSSVTNTMPASNPPQSVGKQSANHLASKVDPVSAQEIATTSISLADSAGAPSIPAVVNLPRRLSLYEILQDVKKPEGSKVNPDQKQSKEAPQAQDKVQEIIPQQAQESKGSRAQPEQDQYKEAPQAPQAPQAQDHDQDQATQRSIGSAVEPKRDQTKEALQAHGGGQEVSKEPAQKFEESSIEPEHEPPIKALGVENHGQTPKGPPVRYKAEAKHDEFKQTFQAPDNGQEAKGETAPDWDVQDGLFATAFDTNTKTSGVPEPAQQYDSASVDVDAIMDTPRTSSDNKAIESVPLQSIDVAFWSSKQAPGWADTVRAVTSNNATATGKQEQKGLAQLPRRRKTTLIPAVPDMRNLKRLTARIDPFEQSKAEVEKVDELVVSGTNAEIQRKAQPPDESDEKSELPDLAAGADLYPKPEKAQSPHAHSSCQSETQTDTQLIEPAVEAPGKVGNADIMASKSSVGQTSPLKAARPTPLRTEFEIHGGDNSAYHNTESMFATPNAYTRLQDVANEDLEKAKIDDAEALVSRTPTPEYSTPPERTHKASRATSHTSNAQECSSAGITPSPAPEQTESGLPGTVPFPVLKKMNDEAKPDMDSLSSTAIRPPQSPSKTTSARPVSPTGEDMLDVSNSMDNSDETLKGDTSDETLKENNGVADDGLNHNIKQNGVQQHSTATGRAKQNKRKALKKKEKKEKAKREAEKQRQRVSSEPAVACPPSTSESPFAVPAPKLPKAMSATEGVEVEGEVVAGEQHAVRKSDAEQVQNFPAALFSQMAAQYYNDFGTSPRQSLDTTGAPVTVKNAPKEAEQASSHDPPKPSGNYDALDQQNHYSLTEKFRDLEHLRAGCLAICQLWEEDVGQVMEEMYAAEKHDFEETNTSRLNATELHRMRVHIDAYLSEPTGFKDIKDISDELVFAGQFSDHITRRQKREKHQYQESLQRPQKERGTPTEDTVQKATKPNARQASTAEHQQAKDSNPAPASFFSHNPLEAIASLIPDLSSRQDFLAKYQNDPHIPRNVQLPRPLPAETSRLLAKVGATVPESSQSAALEQAPHGDKSAELGDEDLSKPPVADAPLSTSKPLLQEQDLPPREPTPGLPNYHIKFFPDLPSSSHDLTSSIGPSSPLRLLSIIIDNEICIANPKDPTQVIPSTYDIKDSDSPSGISCISYKVQAGDKVQYSPVDGSVLSVRRPSQGNKYVYRCVAAIKRDALLRAQVEQNPLDMVIGGFWDRMLHCMEVPKWGQGESDPLKLRRGIEAQMKAMCRHMERMATFIRDKEKIKEKEEQMKALDERHEAWLELMGKRVRPFKEDKPREFRPWENDWNWEEQRGPLEKWLAERRYGDLWEEK